MASVAWLVVMRHRPKEILSSLVSAANGSTLTLTAITVILYDLTMVSGYAHHCSYFYSITFVVFILEFLATPMPVTSAPITLQQALMICDNADTVGTVE